MHESQTKWPADVTAVSLVVAVAAIVCVPLVVSGSLISHNSDFLLYASYHRLARQSLLDHGQWPVRSHLIGGGYPLAGEPESPVFSPSLLLTLCLGEVRGLKAFAIFIYFVLGLGMYWLMREAFGLDCHASVFSAVLIVLSGWPSGRLVSGNYPELCYAFVPALIVLWFRAVERRGSSLGIAVLLAAIMADGRQAWFAIMVFLGGLSLLKSVAIARGKVEVRLEWLMRFAALCVLVLALGMVKIVPMLHTFRLRGRAMPETHLDEYSPESIGAMDHRFIHSFVDPRVRSRQPRVYVGYVPMALFAFACLKLAKKLWRLLALLLLCVWLAMAYHAPIDIFRAAWMLPPFHYIDYPVKYCDFFMVLVVSAAAGCALNWGRQFMPRSAYWIVCLGVGCLTFPPMFHHAVLRLASVFDTHAPTRIDSRGFCHTRGVNMGGAGRHTHGWCNGYFYLLRNMGNLDWETEAPLKTAVDPKYFVTPENELRPNSQYRGEVYLLFPDNRANLSCLSPNRIVVEAELHHPDTLIVNQNYDRRWRTSAGRIKSHEGLLAVELSKTGVYEMSLRYVPWDVYVGLAMSALSFAVALVYRRVRRTLRGNAAPWGRQWALWRRLSSPHRQPLSLDLRDLKRPASAILLVATSAGLALLWATVVTPAEEFDQLLWTGELALGQQAIDIALGCYEAAEKIRPGHRKVLLNMGLCYLAKGDLAAGTSTLVTAAEKWPADAEIRSYLGRAYWQRGNVLVAIAATRMAASLSPYDKSVHKNLATYLAAAGRPDDALDALSRAVELGLDRVDNVLENPAFDELRTAPKYRERLRNLAEHGRLPPGLLHGGQY